MAPYQPKYKWTRTKLDDNDVPTESDWSGHDGESWEDPASALQPYGLKKDLWLWSGHGPRVPSSALRLRSRRPGGHAESRGVL